jgi:hypothetical protein
MVEPRSGGLRMRVVASLGHGREDDLCDDGADLASCSREAVCRRPETGWEALGGDNESGCIRA